jgi:hypothetical protein
MPPEKTVRARLAHGLSTQESLLLLEKYSTVAGLFQNAEDSPAMIAPPNLMS